MESYFPKIPPRTQPVYGSETSRLEFKTAWKYAFI